MMKNCTNKHGHFWGELVYDKKANKWHRTCSLCKAEDPKDLHVERLQIKGGTWVVLADCGTCGKRPTFQEAAEALKKYNEQNCCIRCGKVFEATDVQIGHEQLDDVCRREWSIANWSRADDDSAEVVIDGRVGLIHMTCIDKALPLWRKVSCETGQE